MLDWKTLKVGDKFTWVVDDFDGYSENECIVKEIYEDHLIADCPSISDHLWIDEDCTIK